MFCQLALGLSRLSTCKRLKVGAVLLSGDMSRVEAVGYNGQPSGRDNDGCREAEGACGCIHAEANCLVKTERREEGLVLLSTKSPCEHCAGLILNSRKISAVAYGDEYRDRTGINHLRDGGVLCVQVPWLIDTLLASSQAPLPWAAAQAIAGHSVADSSRTEGKKGGG